MSNKEPRAEPPCVEGIPNGLADPARIRAARSSSVKGPPSCSYFSVVPSRQKEAASCLQFRFAVSSRLKQLPSPATCCQGCILFPRFDRTQYIERGFLPVLGCCPILHPSSDVF